MAPRRTENPERHARFPSAQLRAIPREAPLSIEIRCSCGQVYHADPAHAGRSLRCRCGKTVSIPQAPAAPKSARRASKQRRSASRSRLPLVGIQPRFTRILAGLVWGYLALALVTATFMWILGDRWWPASIMLFGPRWVLLLPAPPLGIAALLTRPRLLLPLAAALVVGIGPVMGYRTGWRGWLAGSRPRALRIITFNVEGTVNPRLTDVPAALARYEADVIVFQECQPRLMEPSLWPSGWTLRTIEGGLCFATRLPLVETRILERVKTGDQGGTGDAALIRLAAPGRTIDVVAVHLETPRKGLAPLRNTGTTGKLEVSLLVREVGARRVSRWIESETHDAVIAGDFNMPVESAIYRAYFGKCPNAFSVVGHGFGGTRVLHRFSARIDHVLGCGAWKPLHAELGPDVGSDHRPLIADLGLTR